MDHITSTILEMMRQDTIQIINSIQGISVKEKRRFFCLLRKNEAEVNEHWIFPAYGITVGELCVAQVLDKQDKSNPPDMESAGSGQKNRKRAREEELYPPIDELDNE